MGNAVAVVAAADAPKRRNGGSGAEVGRCRQRNGDVKMGGIGKHWSITSWRGDAVEETGNQITADSLIKQTYNIFFFVSYDFRVKFLELDVWSPFLQKVVQRWAKFSTSSSSLTLKQWPVALWTRDGHGLFRIFFNWTSSRDGCILDSLGNNSLRLRP